MLSDHLIQEVGEEIDLQDKVGRQKILLSIAPEHSYYIGAEISENSFFCSDRQYRNRIPTGYFFSQPTQTNKMQIFFMQHLSVFIKKVSHKQQIHAIGIAIPGHYTKSNNHVSLTNNAYWKDFNLTEIENRVPVPVYFSNKRPLYGKSRISFLYQTKYRQ